MSNDKNSSSRIITKNLRPNDFHHVFLVNLSPMSLKYFIKAHILENVEKNLKFCSKTYLRVDEITRSRFLYLLSPDFSRRGLNNESFFFQNFAI